MQLGAAWTTSPPLFITTELTPNPATRKFLPGRAVMAAGSRDFASIEAAEPSPLAEALFMLPEVTGVHFGRDFVAVTAGPAADWPGLQSDVANVLVEHFAAGMPLFRADAAATGAPAGDDTPPVINPGDEDIVAQIEDLIETRIRPAVANDGGDIRFRGFDRGNVYLALQGACAGCPSSSATLKHGIESLLKHYVPEVTAVYAV